MPLTRKHYERTAKILKHRMSVTTTYDEHCLMLGLTQSFANWFEEDNERFDRKRFYKACGMDQWIGRDL